MIVVNINYILIIFSNVKMRRILEAIFLYVFKQNQKTALIKILTYGSMVLLRNGDESLDDGE